MDLKVDASKLDDVLCPACGNADFVPHAKLKHLPALLSPSGTAGIVTVSDGVQCLSCKTIITMADMQQMARDLHSNEAGKVLDPSGHPMKAISGHAQKPPIKLIVNNPPKKEEVIDKEPEGA